MTLESSFLYLEDETVDAVRAFYPSPGSLYNAGIGVEIIDLTIQGWTPYSRAVVNVGIISPSGVGTGLLLLHTGHGLGLSSVSLDNPIQLSPGDRLYVNVAYYPVFGLVSAVIETDPQKIGEKRGSITLPAAYTDVLPSSCTKNDATRPPDAPTWRDLV